MTAATRSLKTPADAAALDAEVDRAAVLLTALGFEVRVDRPHPESRLFRDNIYAYQVWGRADAATVLGSMRDIAAAGFGFNVSVHPTRAALVVQFHAVTCTVNFSGHVSRFAVDADGFAGCVAVW